MPDHRGLEPLTQSRTAQTAAHEATAFIAMDAPFMGIAAGATRFNLTFPGVSGEYPLISERTDYAEKVRDALRVERLASVLRIYPYAPWNNAGKLSESLPSGGENSRIGSQNAVDKFEK